MWNSIIQGRGTDKPTSSYTIHQNSQSQIETIFIFIIFYDHNHCYGNHFLGNYNRRVLPLKRVDMCFCKLHRPNRVAKSINTLYILLSFWRSSKYSRNLVIITFCAERKENNNNERLVLKSTNNWYNKDYNVNNMYE